MDKIARVALQEFKMNFARREYKFFAFALPCLLLAIAIILSFSGKQFSLDEFKLMQKSYYFFALPSTIAMVFSLSIFLPANFASYTVRWRVQPCPIRFQEMIIVSD